MEDLRKGVAKYAQTRLHKKKSLCLRCDALQLVSELSLSLTKRENPRREDTWKSIY
jgi:hypothetical protein